MSTPRRFVFFLLAVPSCVIVVAEDERRKAILDNGDKTRSVTCGFALTKRRCKLCPKNDVCLPGHTSVADLPADVPTKLNDVCCDEIGCTNSEIKSIACPAPVVPGSRRSATLPEHVKAVVDEVKREEVVVEHKKLKELVKST